MKQNEEIKQTRPTDHPCFFPSIGNFFKWANISVETEKIKLKGSFQFFYLDLAICLVLVLNLKIDFLPVSMQIKCSKFLKKCKSLQMISTKNLLWGIISPENI